MGSPRRSTSGCWRKASRRSTAAPCASWPSGSWSRAFGEEVGERYHRRKQERGAISVGQEHESVPFSRGILSQSLLAAGLDPDIAHRVAEKIHSSLTESGMRRISRDELRELTYRTILQDFGRPNADYYLLWRKLKRPGRPLILEFEGATGTGKSSLSVEIAHRLGIIRVIGTDTMREVMRGMFSRELLPSIHDSSYTVWKTLKRPLNEDVDPVLSAFQEQSARVSVGVGAVMRRAIKENLSMVIEGVHLIPGPREPEFTERSILIQVFIATIPEELHRLRFVSRNQQAADRSAQKYLENFDSIRRIQAALLEKARQHGIFIVDNIDFDESVRQIIRYLTRRMGELIELDHSEYGLSRKEGVA